MERHSVPTGRATGSTLDLRQCRSLDRSRAEALTIPRTQPSQIKQPPGEHVLGKFVPPTEDLSLRDQFQQNQADISSILFTDRVNSVHALHAFNKWGTACESYEGLPNTSDEYSSTDKPKRFGLVASMMMEKIAEDALSRSRRLSPVNNPTLSAIMREFGRILDGHDRIIGNGDLERSHLLHRQSGSDEALTMDMVWDDALRLSLERTRRSLDSMKQQPRPAETCKVLNGGGLSEDATMPEGGCSPARGSQLDFDSLPAWEGSDGSVSDRDSFEESAADETHSPFPDLDPAQCAHVLDSIESHECLYAEAEQAVGQRDTQRSSRPPGSSAAFQPILPPVAEALTPAASFDVSRSHPEETAHRMQASRLQSEEELGRVDQEIDDGVAGRTADELSSEVPGAWPPPVAEEAEEGQEENVLPSESGNWGMISAGVIGVLTLSAIAARKSGWLKPGDTA